MVMKPRSLAAVTMIVGCVTGLIGGDAFGGTVVGSGDKDDLLVLIAQRAFECYQARGCQDGCDLDDWLEAEREILSQVPPM